MTRSLYVTGLVTFLVLTLVGRPVFSAPVVKTVSTTSSALVKGTEITITGSGFGSKSNPMPVLYDETSKAYVNGSLNTHQGNFSEGQVVQRASSDPGSLWNGGENVVVTYKGNSRHGDSSAHYLGRGASAYLGWPTAYGGQGTPANNQKLFVSWWFRPYRHPRYYWQWGISNMSGNFKTGSSAYQLGEELIIGSKKGNVRGEIIALNGSNLHFIAPGITSSSDISGFTVRGVTSGATATLSGAYQTPGSNKFIRVWEEGTGKNGLRASWTQMHTTLSTPSGSDLVFWKGIDPMKVREWNHLEVEVDLSSNKFRTWLNSKPFIDRDISAALRNGQSFSPTIALVGTNGKQTYQSAEFGEIYMDSTLQRLVIGNDPNWGNVSHTEVQLPVTWADGNVRFKLNLGSLAQANPNSLYVYVFDANGVVNQTGASLCTNCVTKAPPDYPLNIK